MSRPVRIVTDSVADLSPELAKAWQVTVVPLSVAFDDEVYLDRVGIGPEEFYRRLETAHQLPTTSVPSPALFSDAYEALLEAGYDVASIHVSSKVSGTCNVAATAAKGFPAGRIRIVDSGLITVAQLLAVRASAQLARSGAGLDVVARFAEAIAGRCTFYALLDTLDYLKRGGRIGGLAAILGGLLSVKPIVSVRAGELALAARVRSRARGLERLAELTLQHQPFDGPIVVAHSRAPAVAEALRAMLLAECPDTEILVCELGPVVGTHAGPGAVGTGVLWRAG